MDDPTRRAAVHPDIDKMEIESANGDENDGTLHVRSSDASVSFLNHTITCISLDHCCSKGS